jgi:hypothetical protein
MHRSVSKPKTTIYAEVQLKNVEIETWHVGYCKWCDQISSNVEIEIWHVGYCKCLNGVIKLVAR